MYPLESRCIIINTIFKILISILTLAVYFNLRSLFYIYSQIRINMKQSRGKTSMAFGGYGLLGFLVMLVLVFSLAGVLVVSSAHEASASLNRSSFPAGFIFGTASAAYQVFSSFSFYRTKGLVSSSVVYCFECSHGLCGLCF